MTPTPELQPSTRLGPYEILGAVGAGGMGQIYRAKDTRLARDVALKILPSDLASQESFRTRFEALDALDARPLPGTEGATQRAFWSSDSRFIGFIAGGTLKKVEITGGPPQTVCDAPTGADGAWSPEGVILFDGRPNDPILRVPATGGVPRPEVSPDTAKGVFGTAWPEFLPDGRHFLYIALATKAEESKAPSRDQRGEVRLRLVPRWELHRLLRSWNGNRLGHLGAPHEG